MSDGGTNAIETQIREGSFLEFHFLPLPQQDGLRGQDILRVFENARTTIRNGFPAAPDAQIRAELDEVTGLATLRGEFNADDRFENWTLLGSGEFDCIVSFPGIPQQNDGETQLVILDNDVGRVFRFVDGLCNALRAVNQNRDVNSVAARVTIRNAAGHRIRNDAGIIATVPANETLVFENEITVQQLTDWANLWEQAWDREPSDVVNQFFNRLIRETA